MAVSIPSPARAQDKPAQYLSSESADPTASLLTVNVKYDWVFEFHEPDAPIDRDSHEIEFQPVIPFEVFGLKNLMRITMPFEISTPSGHKGLGATSVFDMLIFSHGWGRWGVGPLLNFVSEPGEEGDHFQIGPALGLVARLGELNLGLFNQNFFSSDVAVRIGVRDRLARTALDLAAARPPDQLSLQAGPDRDQALRQSKV